MAARIAMSDSSGRVPAVHGRLRLARGARLCPHPDILRAYMTDGLEGRARTSSRSISTRASARTAPRRSRTCGPRPGEEGSARWSICATSCCARRSPPCARRVDLLRLGVRSRPPFGEARGVGALHPSAPIAAQARTRSTSEPRKVREPGTRPE
jgi:hypothetical protein